MDFYYYYLAIQSFQLKPLQTTGFTNLIRGISGFLILDSIGFQ
jgi:hypothetical protein